MKRQWNETHEAVGPVLQLSQPDEMVNTILEGFDVAVENRRICMDSASMNFFCEFEPSLSRCLVRADLTSGWVAKNLGATTRTAVQPSVYQTIDHLLIGHPTNSREVIELNHSESFQMHIRKAPF